MVQSYINGNTNANIEGISSYGALLLPFDLDLAEEQAQTQTDPKEKTSFMGKLKSAIKNSKDNLSENIKQNKNVKILAEYMQDKRNIEKLGSAFGVVGSKFSGIAVTQAIIDGKITSKEARDYFFMGFAPAIGVQGSLMGYSGLSQMKDALTNGDINVGEFISGFRTTLKGATDLKDMLTKKNTISSANIIEFDLTISHNMTFQSEAADRRVQRGQSLNEYVHNMPDIFSVSCALQEGKRYSKAEFKAIIQEVRRKKEVVSLILGDELFDNLILTDFSPNEDCSKSGMDYTLSFKKINRSDIDTTTEVTIQQAPKTLEEDSSMTIGGVGSLEGGKGLGIKDVLDKETTDLLEPQKTEDGALKSSVLRFRDYVSSKFKKDK